MMATLFITATHMVYLKGKVVYVCVCVYVSGKGGGGELCGYRFGAREQLPHLTHECVDGHANRSRELVVLDGEVRHILRNVIADTVVMIFDCGLNQLDAVGHNGGQDIGMLVSVERHHVQHKKRDTLNLGLVDRGNDLR